MANFRNKIQALADRTASAECRHLCEALLAGTQFLPEPRLKERARQVLSAMSEDASTAEFMKRLDNDLRTHDLGVSEALSEISKVSAGDPTFKYKFASFEAQKANGTPDHLMVEAVAELVRPYRFDPVLRAVTESLDESIRANRVAIELKKLDWTLSQSNSAFMYGRIQEAIQEYLETGSSSGRDFLIGEMSNSRMPTFAQAVRYLKESAASEGSTQIVESSDNCRIDQIVSPVLFEDDGSQTFTDRSNFYRIHEGRLTRLTPDEVGALPKKYISLVESFLKYPLQGDRISANFGRDRVSVDLQTGQAFLNETEVKDLQSLGGLGYFQFGNAQIGSDLISLQESRSVIFDLDYAKKISSKIYEGASLTVFKVGDDLYANKFNRGMMENEFSKVTATQLQKTAREFLSFELGESLAEFLTKERQQADAILTEQEEVRKTIDDLALKVSLLESKRDQNPKFESEINAAISLVESEIAELHREFGELESKRRKVLDGATNEDVAQDCDFRSGDKVKIRGSKSEGEVTSVNTTDCTVDVLLDDGKTTTFKMDQLQSLEKEIEDRESEQNPESAEVNDGGEKK